MNWVWEFPSKVMTDGLWNSTICAPTGEIPILKIAKALRETVDFRPAAIISYFGLRKPIFAPLSAYGHFGREELGVRFEKTDIADIIADKLGLKI